jgi:ribosome-binding ATPase YchF (GTP1/OBG family)
VGKSTLFNALTGAAASAEKVLPEFDTDILDAQGEVVARVHRTLYVRLKPRHRPA